MTEASAVDMERTIKAQAYLGTGVRGGRNISSMPWSYSPFKSCTSARINKSFSL